MLKQTIKLLCTALFIHLICVQHIQAQDKKVVSPLNNLDFEEIIPDFISVSKGKISLSKKHRVTGKTSLRWDFEPGDELMIKGDIGYQPQKFVEEIDILGEKYPQTNEPVLFKLPFYSEQEQEATLRVQFGTGDQVDCFIDIRLAFDGWRKFAIPYDRGHLRGEAKVGMNFMRIVVQGESKGRLYFDNPIFAYQTNPRKISSDPLVPELKNHPQRLGSQGGGEVKKDHLYRAWFPIQNKVSAEQKESFKTIEDRFYELAWGGRRKLEKLDASKLKKFQNEYAYFNISRTDKSINGLHFDSSKDLSKFNQLIKNIGIAYQSVQDKDQKLQLAQMGVNLIEHGIDIDNTITWYHGRGFADGCYLLKEELRNANLLDKTIKFLRRKLSFTQFYNEDVVRDRHGKNCFSSDAIYCDTHSFILCALIMDETPEKVRDMQHLVSFYSNVAFNYAPGLTDTFKPDGSHFHHANAALTRYGAYTMPMVAETIRILSRTEFHISEEAHNRMKHNVLVRRFYRSKKYFPFAYSHNRIRPLEFSQFDDSRHLALAGTPDGKEDIDTEMAAVYLRMMNGADVPKDAEIFKERQIHPESTPNGHHTLSYHAKAIHRHNDLMSVVGGHSRYIFQKENWSWHTTRGDVKFGMFENWGALELIYPDNPNLKQIDNGRTIEGWDWTKIPGVTSFEAPLNRIKIQTLKRGDDAEEEHLRSDQPFVGGLDFSDGNGIFVMKLRGHHKYKMESFYATKSWFFFGDLIVCLGSDIRNDLPEYSTHTCLFQNSFDITNFALSLNKTRPLKDKPFELTNQGETNNWIVDSRKVGYFIPNGQPFKVSYGLQRSRCFQDRKDTEAKIEKAWLLHGNAPDGESYEYAVKMNTTASAMKTFASDQAEQQNYQVIQADKNAHIVKHPESKSTAYIIYDANYNLNVGLIKGVSHSGIFMLKEEDGKLTLAASDPDLRFYEGFNTDISDLQLNRKESPSYSHHWYANPSIPSKVKVFLKGTWDISSLVKGNGKIVQQNNDLTVVEFECKDGLTNELELKIK